METPSADIGALLRERRKQLGVTLQAAADQTRIRRAHLESLEENRFADLPGRAYVTGFIRVYARFLGMDSDELLARADELLPEAGRQARLTPLPGTPSSRPGRPRARGRGRWASYLAVILLVLVGGALYLRPLFVREPQPVAIPPAVEAPSLPAAESATGAPSDAAMTNSAVLGAGEGSTGASVDAVPPVGATPAAESSSAAAPAPFPVIPAGGVSLRMLALAEGSLMIRLDGREPHEYRLRNGLDLTWKPRNKVEIELAGPGLARFWLGVQELELGDRTSIVLQSAGAE